MGLLRVAIDQVIVSFVKDSVTFQKRENATVSPVSLLNDL